jgi:Homeodomain-like domain
MTASRGPRRARLAALYELGITNREIARRLGISAERVRQLLQRYRIPAVPLDERRYLTAVRGHETEVIDAFLSLRADTAVALQLGLEERHVRRLVDATVPEANVLRRTRRRRRSRYTDADLIAALQEAARDLPSPMGYEAFNAWAAGRQRNGLPWPGPQVVSLRFGGWRRALTLAGLPANAAGGRQATYDRQGAINAVAAAWRELGRAPSVTGYETWRAGRSHLPSPATARRFATGWDDLLVACYPLVYGSPDGPQRLDDPAP